MKPINWLLMYSNMTKDLGSSKFHVGRFERIKVMITCCAPWPQVLGPSCLYRIPGTTIASDMSDHVEF
ncbi:MAG: hypothetical protein WCE25_09660 [Nitrososphaeraceae archaeon]